jgi:hypothetical protein
MDQNAEVLPGLDIFKGRWSPAESDNTEHYHPLQHTINDAVETEALMR